MAVTVFSMVGKFSVSAAWQIMIVWQSELYPTLQRCGLGSINSLVGRVGGFMAPFMLDLVSV